MHQDYMVAGYKMRALKSGDGINRFMLNMGDDLDLSSMMMK